MFLMLANRREEALAMLEQSFSHKNLNILAIGVHPLFDPLRDNPRFVAIAEAVGLADVNRATKRKWVDSVAATKR
jgi:hypothetical protein